MKRHTNELYIENKINHFVKKTKWRSVRTQLLKSIIWLISLLMRKWRGVVM